MEDVNELTERLIAIGIEVHRQLGPGLHERAYEEAFCIELQTASIPYARQLGIPVYYKGHLIAEHRPDLVVGGRVVVEIKHVDKIAPVHRAQVLTYLQITGVEVGLILNSTNQH